MLGFLECRRKKMLRGVVCGRRCAVRWFGRVFVDGWKLDERIFL